MAILKIKQPNGSWAIVGDTSETIKFTEQQLTEEQKEQARLNIGAKAEAEEFIEITTPDVFVFDVDTMTWTYDPLKSYILTESNWPELEEGGWNTHQCTYTVGDIVRGEIIGIEEYEGKQLYNIKQTIYHSAAMFEHYRYFLVAENQLTWSLWYRSTEFPKESNGSIPSYILALGQSTEQTNFSSGLNTVYYSAQSLVEEYGKLSFVSSDTAQNFSDTQKAQARDNIGAISVEISETPKDGEILVYDATSNKLVNSGYTFASLKEWIQQEINNTILNGEW